jgi:hypothetical protein
VEDPVRSKMFIDLVASAGGYIYLFPKKIVPRNGIVDHDIDVVESKATNTLAYRALSSLTTISLRVQQL